MNSMNNETMNQDRITAYVQVCDAAALSALQGLCEDFSYDGVHGVMVHGQGESVLFFQANTGSGNFYLTDCDVPVAGRKEMRVTPQEAAELIRNLTPEEIADFLARAQAGKHPALTDYIAEDEILRV